MTITEKPVQQRNKRKYRTNKSTDISISNLYLFQIQRSNDEPASQRVKNQRKLWKIVRIKMKPWRWSPPYNMMRTWTTNTTNLPRCKESASTSRKSATSESDGNLWTALQNYSGLPEYASQLLLTTKTQILQTKKHRNKLIKLSQYTISIQTDPTIPYAVIAKQLEILK